MKTTMTISMFLDFLQDMYTAYFNDNLDVLHCANFDIIGVING
jgi:hypothetical protein